MNKPLIGRNLLDLCDFESPPKSAFCISSGLPARNLEELTEGQRTAASVFFEDATKRFKRVQDLLASDPNLFSHSQAEHEPSQTPGPKLLIEVQHCSAFFTVQPDYSLSLQACE